MEIEQTKGDEAYDENKAELQSKTILELQNDIKEFQKRERAHLVQLHLKDKEIRYLENYKNDLKRNKTTGPKTDLYSDPVILNEFKTLKNLIKEKDEILVAKDEELNALQTNINHPSFKKLVNKCRELHKENMELFNYTQGGPIQNLRHENKLEKEQIDQLMLKLKEKENIHTNMGYEINEISEVISFLYKRMIELETKISSAKDNKSSKKHRD